MRHPVYSRICLCIVWGQGKTIRTRFLTKFICSTALALSMWAHCLSSQCCVRFRNASSLQFWQHWKTTASLVSTERQQCAVICFRCPTAHIVEGDLVTKTRLKSTTRKPLCSTLFFCQWLGRNMKCVPAKLVGRKRQSSGRSPNTSAWQLPSWLLFTESRAILSCSA